MGRGSALANHAGPELHAAGVRALILLQVNTALYRLDNCCGERLYCVEWSAAHDVHGAKWELFSAATIAAEPVTAKI